MEVLKNVFLLQTSCPYPYPMNSYLILDEKIALIDTSSEDPPDELIKKMKSVGISLEDLDYIFLTHPHMEHLRALNYLKKHSLKCQVLAGPLAAKILPQIERSVELALSRINLELGHMQRYWRTLKSLKVDRIVKDGDVLSLGKMSFKVLDFPGHCSELLTLHYEQQKVLFSSDFIIGGDQPTWVAANPFIMELDGNRAHYHESLLNVEQLKDDLQLILPAHGPIIEKPKERIESLFRLEREMEEKVMQSIGTSPKPLRSIVEGYYEKKFTDEVKYFHAARFMRPLLEYLIEKKEIGKKGENFYLI